MQDPYGIIARNVDNDGMACSERREFGIDFSRAFFFLPQSKKRTSDVGCHISLPSLCSQYKELELARSLTKIHWSNGMIRLRWYSIEITKTSSVPQPRMEIVFGSGSTKHWTWRCF